MQYSSTLPSLAQVSEPDITAPGLTPAAGAAVATVAADAGLCITRRLQDLPRGCILASSIWRSSCNSPVLLYFVLLDFVFLSFFLCMTLL